ncbi:MAG: aminomethyltransferase family protein [Pyrinomonadaceae bacterium]
MNEATELATARKSPLHETHVRLGARLLERDGWLIPASYGDELFEYAAVRERGAGVIDLSSRGRFLVSGTEAVQFLNGLITNDMKTLADGQWMPAAFPNVQGRLLASIRVARLKDEFLLDTEAATRAQVLNTLQRFTLAGDFHVSDITDQTALLSIQGKGAAGIFLAVVDGEKAGARPENSVDQIEWRQKQLTVLHATHTSEDGFDVVADSGDSEAIWTALTHAKAQPVGYDALERLRIEAGVPRYGIDVDEGTVVTEALEDVVSYAKGCYIGQEIIARIKYRGHVAKKLVGMTFDRIVKLSDDRTIRSADGREIGRITSATLSPHLGRTIALGYVKYDYVTPGTAVKLSGSAGEIAAHVSELPFIRGRWYADRKVHHRDTEDTEIGAVNGT